MTPHQSIAIGVRLFSVWLILNALSTGYFVLITPGTNGLPGTLALGIVLTLIWMAVAAVLWHFPQAVAHKLLSLDDSAREPDSDRSPAENWFAVGCALIGIWLIVSSLPVLAGDIAGAWPSMDIGGSAIYFVVRIVLGVGLILGSRRLRVTGKYPASGLCDSGVQG